MGCGTGRHLEEFVKRGLNVKCEFPLPVQYEGIKIEAGFRADMIVDDAVIIENKTVDKIAPIYPVK
jgi:GxxExxY protein